MNERTGELLVKIGISIAVIVLFGGIIALGFEGRNNVIRMQGIVEEPTILNKTGYVENIVFIEGGLFTPSQTVVHFDDGGVLTLRWLETDISVKHNVTLYYHDNGYGEYFLDGIRKEG